MYNVNPETGIRYGVISAQSLDPDLLDELFHGNGAVDLSYQEAYNEAKAEAQRNYASLLEEAAISAAESGADREPGFDQEDYEEKWFEFKDIEHDPEIFVERELERFSDMCQIDEPTYEGEYEGVKYRLSTLGGAYLLWVFEGPLGLGNRLCSPCVPNAVDLDGGFALDTEFEEGYIPDSGYSCYCVPRDWLYAEVTV